MLRGEINITFVQLAPRVCFRQAFAFARAGDLQQLNPLVKQLTALAKLQCNLAATTVVSHGLVVSLIPGAAFWLNVATLGFLANDLEVAKALFETGKKLVSVRGYDVVYPDEFFVDVQTTFKAMAAVGKTLPSQGASQTTAPKSEGGAARFKRTASSEDWSSRVAGLLAKDATEPQLWLHCRKASMAVAILSRRPPSTDAHLSRLPELVDDGDGSAGAVFFVKNGRNIRPLLKDLFAGSYGDDTPVVTNGVTVCLPREDQQTVLGIFGRSEALAMGNVVSW